MIHQPYQLLAAGVGQGEDNGVYFVLPAQGPGIGQRTPVGHTA